MAARMEGMNKKAAKAYSKKRQAEFLANAKFPKKH